MKLILKEVQGLIVNQLQNEIVDTPVNVYCWIWEGFTQETNTFEIDFDSSELSFSTYYKEDRTIFEFIDMSDESKFSGNTCIFELSGIDFKSYEVV